MPNRNLANLVAAISVLIFGFFFLSFKLVLHSVNIFHLLFVFTILTSYFLHPQTRKFILIAFPLALFGLMYDFFQYIPFESLQPIRVAEPYHIDLHLFGVFYQSKLIPLHEYLHQIFQNKFFDLYCGVTYMMHVPMILLLLLAYWIWGSEELAAKFIFAFWFMNFLAFLTYFFYAAAPPWYVTKYGFLAPNALIPGDPAGLLRFDQILGLNLFSQNYKISSVPFGAIPSMHAGFSMLGFLYSFSFKRKLISAFLGFYCFSVCFSALYLQHHYLIDLILGIFYAALSFWIVEKKLREIFLKTFRSLKLRLVNQADFVLLRSSK